MSHRRSGLSISVGIVAVLLPILYALSAGPAYNLVRGGMISEPEYERFYCPVLWLVRTCRPIDDFGRKYRDFWATDQ